MEFKYFCDEIEIHLHFGTFPFVVVVYWYERNFETTIYCQNIMEERKKLTFAIDLTAKFRLKSRFCQASILFREESGTN